MNLEEINKWLDENEGMSYTRLEELHDFIVWQNVEYKDKIDKAVIDIEMLIEIIQEQPSNDKLIYFKQVLNLLNLNFLKC